MEVTVSKSCRRALGCWDKTIMKNWSRRRVLSALSLLTAVAAAPRALGAAVSRLFPKPGSGDFFIHHNDQPWALETLRSAYGVGPITPISHFFVRNNLPMPADTVLASPDDWTVTIEGCVEADEITLAELKRLPTHTVANVIQCSGNGRAFFPHAPSGSPWAVGAAGCALWTGVRVSDIFECFGGLDDDYAFVTATGGEPLPEGINPDTIVVQRSVPLEKGMTDCMLVWEMNGTPLPLIHGGPVRLLVPGYFGVNNVKWVKALGPTRSEASAKIQQSGYRLRPVGDRGGPKHPSMWRMPVKSWINTPGSDGQAIAPGPCEILGVAFSGERGVSQVEISIDGGQSWQLADFIGPDLGANAWRSFRLSAELNPGRYRLVSRATDRYGDQQPKDRIDNERGYGHTGWHDHGINLIVDAAATLADATRVSTTFAATATSGTAVAASLPVRRQSSGYQLFNRKTQPSCGTCHALAAAGSQGAIGPNLDQLAPNADQIRKAVAQGVGAMPGYSEQLTSTEIEALVRFITDSTSP